MKRLIYQVCVGQPSKLYEHCIKSVKDYCSVYGIDHIVQTEPILKIQADFDNPNCRRSEDVKEFGYLPIFEKENAFDYFDRYDQIIILDADIWIRPKSPNIFEELVDCDFAGVLERDLPIDERHRAKLVNYTQMQYGSIQLDWQWNESGAAFYNMGLMCMNKHNFEYYLQGMTPEQFIRQPYFKPFVDGEGPFKWSTDQTLLNVWVKAMKMRLKNLDWKWNALYTAVPNEMIKDAYFVHFYLKDKLPNNGENVDELMELVE